MRAYVAHNVDENEDLLANLEMAKGEVVVAQQMVEEGVGLRRKAKEEKEASQAEVHWLAKNKATMAAKKEKVEEKTVRLRQEL